eukprot:s2836_g9.t1
MVFFDLCITGGQATQPTHFYDELCMLSFALSWTASMKRCCLLLPAALFSFVKCNPDISHGPAPSSQRLLSLEDLQDMISSLEERRRQLRSNTTSPAQRRLGMHSHSDSEMADSETAELTPTKQATCGFDIIGVTLAVARAGTVLYFVQDSCKTQETINQKHACAATISGLFSTIGFLISFMSDSINACQTTLRLGNRRVEEGS